MKDETLSETVIEDGQTERVSIYVFHFILFNSITICITLFLTTVPLIFCGLFVNAIRTNQNLVFYLLNKILQFTKNT